VTLLCLALALFYRTMPNTKVRWNAAVVGGLVGGILWHLNNLISVLYVSRVVSNSKIYGSLGLVPVFMIGLYLSWWILLFGAQVAYAFQNRGSYLEQRQVETIDQRGRELIALRLMAWIGRRFLQGEPPPSIIQMGKEFGVPTRLIQHLMETLCAAHLILEVSGQEPAYMPTRPLEQITCHDILLALRTSHAQQLTAHAEPTTSKIYGEFQRIEQAEQAVASSVSLRALAEVSRAGIHETRPEPPSRRVTESKRRNSQRSLTE
jgi:membrane protein